MERRNQAHIFGGTFLIFLAAGSKQGMLIFLLGGTKSLSQALGPSNALFEIFTQIIKNILIYYNYDPKTYINTLECLNNESVENFHEKNRVNSEKRKEGNRGEGKNDRNKKTPKPIKEAQTVPAPASRKSKECKAKNQHQIEKTNYDI